MSPLHARIYPSRYYFLLVFFIFIVAWVVIWHVPIPMFVQIILSVLAFLAMWFPLRKFFLQKHSLSVHELVWQSEEGWQVVLAEEEKIAVTLQRKVVTRPLVSLRFRSLNQKQVFHVVLLKDSMQPKKLRQLRRLLNVLKG